MFNSSRENIVEGLAEIQWTAYEVFGIDSYPNGNIGVIWEVEGWMRDQIRKCAFLDMIDEEAIEMADEEYNAHWVADIAREECL